MDFIERVLRLRFKLTAPIVRWAIRRRGVILGSDVSMWGRPIVSVAGGSKIVIGDRVVLTSVSRMTALGVARRVILRTMGAGAEIVIGSDTGVSGTTICARTRVRIGERCLFGADVLIADTDFHAVDVVSRRWLPVPPLAASDEVSIGDDVFIGARTIVTKGVSIGSGSVIGAGSVVTADIPSRVVAAGVPARVVRALDAAG